MPINSNNPRWADLSWWEKPIIVLIILLMLTVGVGVITFFLATLIYLVQLWLNVLEVLL